MYKSTIVFTDGLTKKYKYEKSTIRDGLILLERSGEITLVLSIANLKYIEND